MLNYMPVPDVQECTRWIIEKLNSANDSDYIGEAVTQKIHALQCAYFAETLGHDESVIIASLLHDIGHFCYKHPLPMMDELGVINHEWLGARIALELGFSSEVADLIGYHVQAKRYLTAKKPAYYKRLSSASKGTLAFQGGLMTDEEVTAFEQNPLFKKALQVRANDEKGKILDLSTPTPENFAPMIEKHLLKNRPENKAEKHLYFVRHAPAEGQDPEASLTDEGQNSLKGLVTSLRECHADMVISSPFKRARQTATAIAQSKNHRFFIDERLKEFGESVNESDMLPVILDTINDIQRSVLNNYIIITHGNWLTAMISQLFPEAEFAGIEDLKRPHVIKVTIDKQGKKIIL